ncbi:MAG: hypothetical protein N5P05_003740 [Chroococcopsis gigantea SAG 12.99]|jgi:hypothetical protein|nr:hypothetical protein [Chroococcopsis gigantea SAG 12.99]
MNKYRIKSSRKRLYLLPLIFLGAGLFYLNSNAELNYFLRGYLTILELQGGALILYLLMKLKK